jgi:hypothetical protein
MIWIKRNLLMVASIAVGLVLLGLAIWYLVDGIQAESAMHGDLVQVTEKLQTLKNMTPTPGTENINIASADTKKLKAFMADAEKFFVGPPSVKLDDMGFRSLLETSVSELRRSGSNATVGLPPNYNFTFGAQLAKAKYAVGSTEPLAKQLAEIKMLCGILYSCKIHSLEAIKRSQVSTDDTAGSADFFSDRRVVTNEFGVAVPYQLDFRSFTPELAAVLNALARSREFIVVKNLIVQTTETPAVAGAAPMVDGMAAPTPMVAPPGGSIPPAPPGTPPGAPGQPRPASGRPGAAPPKPVYKIELDEKPLRISLTLELTRPVGASVAAK